MARTRKLFAALTRRGPHRVLRGDLAFAGLPGTVYTPASGLNLPGVAFGHDWLTGVDHYLKTLEHLASWGIVAAAPGTEGGLAPSVLNLAFDLGTTLDIITGVRLGPGQISVHPTKLGLAGHGFGGSAAVFAAAGLSGAGATAPKAVAALFPSVTKPPAQQPAASLKVPGLVLSAPDDAHSLRTDALDLAGAWKGSVLHIVSKAQAPGLAEKRRFAGALGLPGSDRRTQKTARALLTGFLLFHLTGDKDYREFADPEAVLPNTEQPDPELPPVTPEERIVALLK
ncbi:dienelactone hydrolase family protein [Mycobacterium sp. shizuoka-1]|uniref:dienelactone hydrolase family protein n=1 Tax=Mycobacterium sp. shizuoka-1 TaxID=2039281 RepID=UPI000C05D097|nr:hypothetical protein [Mycobacterium sp. shizuoka-1]GAY14966.1 alpha/beta hydrolase [Mycobacterium sp. shizuoka-1]